MSLRTIAVLTAAELAASIAALIWAGRRLSGGN